MNITIVLSPAQIRAAKKLGLEDELQKIVANAAKSAIKGKFTYYAKTEQEQLTNTYKAATKMGAKFDEAMPAWLDRMLSETKDIVSEL